jgi:hypothetical protein
MCGLIVNAQNYADWLLHACHTHDPCTQVYSGSERQTKKGKDSLPSDPKQLEENFARKYVCFFIGCVHADMNMSINEPMFTISQLYVDLFNWSHISCDTPTQVSELPERQVAD